AWTDPDAGHLHVGVRDAAAATVASRAGALPAIMARSTADLDRTLAAVEAMADSSPPAGEVEWGVDDESDTVEVDVEGDGSDVRTADFVRRGQALGQGIEIVTGLGRAVQEGDPVLAGQAIRNFG